MLLAIDVGNTNTVLGLYRLATPEAPAALLADWRITTHRSLTVDELGVIFREDLSRLRTGHGPHNMGTVRHMAMNLLRSAKPGKSLKVRRKVAGWDPSYLHAILQGRA